MATAPAADPATSMAALAVAPATFIGAVTTCVHPDNKRAEKIVIIVIFFIAVLYRFLLIFWRI